VLADYRTAPIREPLRAMLGFLEKLALAPAAVGPADVAPLRAAGLSDAAIEQAIHVSAAFHVINRLADSFGFAIPPPEDVAFGAADLLKHGYDR
jgi:alkylhydroperoxidase family enzyme